VYRFKERTSQGPPFLFTLSNPKIFHSGLVVVFDPSNRDIKRGFAFCFSRRFRLTFDFNARPQEGPTKLSTRLDRRALIFLPVEVHGLFASRSKSAMLIFPNLSQRHFFSRWISPPSAPFVRFRRMDGCIEICFTWPLQKRRAHTSPLSRRRGKSFFSIPQDAGQQDEP